MKKTLLLIAALLPTQVFALDINCEGNISNVLDSPGHCNGNLAFQIKATGSTWICSSSTTGNSLILTAQATKRTLNFYMHDGAQSDGSGAMTCATIPHYQTPRYMILKAS